MVETRCRELRIKLGWSRIQLAAASGTGYTTVRKLDQGDRIGEMRVSSLVSVAFALGVSAAELVPGLKARPAGGPRRGPADRRLTGGPPAKPKEASLLRTRRFTPDTELIQ